MKSMFISFALMSVAFCNEVTTSRSKIECTSQNCIISISNMDDEKFDDIISEDQSGILALKFLSCKMSRIPSFTFDKLPSLLWLMITTPGLSSLKKGDFSEASSLQFLYLPGNRIKALLRETFSGATNLNDINLSENELETVSEEAFNGLVHLESLNLSRNLIAFLDQSTFAMLTDLMNLDLSGNMIEFLDARLFINNSKLNKINVADNQILSITYGFLDILTQINVVNLMNNPCTNDTALQNTPFVKILDSKDLNSFDENSLENCFKNFLNMADTESTDFEDLLDKAEIVRDDIEGTIISNLNEQLRDRDITIMELTRDEDLLKIAILLIFSVVFFFAILKLIIHIVNSTEIKKTSSEGNIQSGPKKIIYTIEV